jgi:uncharacterized RDD family membrane protein YckC
MTMNEEPTLYDVLGVEPAASKTEVKNAYQGALDTAEARDDTEQIAVVRRAWQVLSDPVQRQRYDEEHGLLGATALARTGTDADREVVEGEIVDDESDEGDEGETDPRAARRMMARPADMAAFLEMPTLGRRLTASLIDVITMLALFLATITVTFQITGATSGIPAVATFVGWVEFWIIALFVYPTIRTGQTLGKRFTYLMTVDRASGNLCGIPQVIRRYIVPMLVIPLLLQAGAFLSLFYGLSFSMSRDQVSLADRVAKTAVVIARYKPSRPGRGA